MAARTHTSPPPVRMEGRSPRHKDGLHQPHKRRGVNGEIKLGTVHRAPPPAVFREVSPRNAVAEAENHSADLPSYMRSISTHVEKLNDKRKQETNAKFVIRNGAVYGLAFVQQCKLKSALTERRNKQFAQVRVEFS